MGLKILIGRDGKPRETWYGRISIKGILKTINLDVKVEGSIPIDEKGNIRLSSKGDKAFEESRKKAKAAFKTLQTECRKDPADLQRKAYKARTGVDLEGLPLAKLYANWKNVARKKKPTQDWCDMIKGWFNDFATFAQNEAKKHRKRCENVNDVTPEIVKLWFDKVNSEYAWETVLKMKHLMSGTFTRLMTLGMARINPFCTMQLRGGGDGENKKVSRKALDSAETERLFEYARKTEINGLVVTAACTGMRLGDVCNLKWDDVDLKAKLINCTTAKTKSKVTIPIFDRLIDVLTERAPIPGDGSTPSPFVFPEWAEAYNKTNDKGHHTTRNKIVQAVKPLFAKAVFGECDDDATNVETNGRTIRSLEDAMNDTMLTPKHRDRLLFVYSKYKAGARNIDIAAELGVARSVICGNLREIEKLTGERLRPRSDAHDNRKTRLDLIEQTRAKRGVGKRAASVYGWHSFRHTFVILALNRGVEEELVKMIVGHKNAKTTIENYFNPEKKHAAELMREKMRGSVLDGDSHKSIGAVVDVPTDSEAVAPVARDAATQALALARAVIGGDQAAMVKAVIRAAGVDADKQPERALAIIAAAVDADTKTRIANVIQAARGELKN